MRRAPALIPLAALAAALACGSEPAAPGEAERFRFVPVAAPGLDVVQIGGGAAIDYIIESLGCGAAWLDYDGDGDPDLYLVQGAGPEDPRNGPPDRLLRNDGDPDGDGIPSFTDVTTQAGLGDRLWGVGVSVADHDNDGDPDLYVTNWGANRLYRNNGDGSFTDVAGPAGVADPGTSASSAWSDVDRDGDLDLYVTNYVEFDFDRYPARGEQPGNAPPCMWRGVEVFCGPRNLVGAADRFYRNEGDPDGDGVPRFVEATREAGLIPEEPMYALAAHFFDADEDGDDDLYVANDSLRNLYFVNRGDGTFEEQSILAGIAYNEQGAEQAGMGIASADYDGDGRLDLFVTNFSHDHDTLYRNEGGDLFTDVSYTSGIGSPSYLTLGWGVAFADLDLDGRVDLFVAHGHVYPQVDRLETGTTFAQTNALFANRGDGTFDDVSAAAGPGLVLAGSSRAVLPVDLEGDGDLDLLVTGLNAVPELLRNDGAGGAWLAVRLRGSASNRDGIGARIIVHASGGTQTREVRRDASFAGSTLPVAHFGLGAASRIDGVEVRWPSGRTSRLENVRPGRLLLVEEPDSGPEKPGS